MIKIMIEWTDSVIFHGSRTFQRLESKSAMSNHGLWDVHT